MITRIEVDVQAMRTGEPCWIIDAGNAREETWKGFTSYHGDVYVYTGDGKAWIEHHGERENLIPEGRAVIPLTEEGATPQIERVMFNYLPALEAVRLRENPTLVYVGVNKRRVADRRPSAVTFYMYLGGALVPHVKLDGFVRSVTVDPPILGKEEPLNAWIEGKVERLVSA